MGRIKGEAGESPALTRNCKSGREILVEMVSGDEDAPPGR
jgi:hypothetical protein